MITDARTRRLGAIAVAVVTAVAGAWISASSGELQPVALPVVFGVALATAIDPRLWLLNLAITGAGLVLVDLVPAFGGGPGQVDTRLLASALVPAFIGAAMVRLACRSAL
ncbi:hypothetical protein [Prosthecomicrobium sp. N25]|uniref:hypothetical protein n=1 Tax=Prosthecomicrobium sp. N25 TaxID=3129254 RepID=UPI003077F644